MSKRRTFNAAFKAKVAREALKEQKTLLELSQDFKISPAQIAKWKGQALDSLPQAFEKGSKQTKDPDLDVESLYSQIGKLQMQLDFLKKKQGLTSTEKRCLIDPNHPHLSIEAQCEALGLNRSTYYYKPVPESLENINLMRMIEELHYEHPEYGYRKIHATLRRLQ